jgi:hypothetical protein
MIDLNPFVLQENNRPLDDFQGLTPMEMHCLLYQPLSDNCVVRLKPNLSDDVLDRIPFFRLIEDFMTLIESNKGVVKLTRGGALPKVVVEELYNKGHLPDDSIDAGIHKLHRESDSTPIKTAHVIVKEMGLVKKRHNRLSLTKKSEKIRRDRSALLKELLLFYAGTFNWGYNDLYPYSPVGQLAWPFNLYLLHTFKNERYDALDYGAMYLLAFPKLLDDFEETHFATAELNFFRAYAVRTIERFLVWFGFVKGQPGIRTVEKDVVVTPLLWEVFDFD